MKGFESRAQSLLIDGSPQHTGSLSERIFTPATNSLSGQEVCMGGGCSSLVPNLPRFSNQIVVKSHMRISVYRILLAMGLRLAAAALYEPSEERHPKEVETSARNGTSQWEGKSEEQGRRLEKGECLFHIEGNGNCGDGGLGRNA